MCDRCIEIDRSITQYKALRIQTSDQLATRAAEELLKRLEAEKQKLHAKE